MKKLVALLLCLSILVPMAALADDVFYVILSTLGDEEILGDPAIFTKLDAESSKTCILSIDLSSSQIMLFGDDTEGVTYGAMWQEVETTKMYAILAYYTGHYKEMDDLDPNDFVIGLKLDAEEDMMYITDAEDAQMIYEILQSATGDE